MSGQSPRFRRSARALALVVGLAAVAAGASACGDDPISPREVAGRYVYAGHWPVFPTLDQAMPRIDTLHFIADGSGMQIRHVLVRLSPTSIPEVQRVLSPLQYRVKGRTIYVTYLDPTIHPTAVAGARDVDPAKAPALPDAARLLSTVPGPHLEGTLTSRGLILTSAFSAGDTIAYRRIVDGTPLSPLATADPR